MRRFGSGFTKFVDDVTYNKYIQGAEMISSKNNSRFFVVPKEVADNLVQNTFSVSEYVQKLGLKMDNSELANIHGFYRIDIPFDLKYKPGLPSGTESGANEFFRKGGFTSGKLPELTIDPVSTAEVVVTQVIKETL